MLFADEANAFVCVYSSENGNWGNVISTAFSFGNLAYHSDILVDFSLDLWKNKTNCDDATGWVLERTIQLDKLLSVEPGPRITSPCLGFVEEHNMLFVSTRIGAFLVHLE
ncbi:Os10g0136750 [Oryza sativa Japonica Group]|uniref:Os10g0136750 protein n=1 Tax=Oryza sativa subsp. japonica TaxID=39947 RepID=A0A0P0XS98_ORYSJ|nr:Os10g0136750 [Oryza sativa Japonica Group]